MDIFLQQVPRQILKVMQLFQKEELIKDMHFQFSMQSKWMIIDWSN